jgi:hypothetical protein
MASYRCFRCGRELSAIDSVNNGVGPVCAAKRSAALDADLKTSRENRACHHGFTCYAPDHGLTTIGRFVHRFMAMADQTGLPNDLRDEAMTLTRKYVDALGLKRKRVEVPVIEVPPFGDPQSLRDLNLPIEHTPHGDSVKMPHDYEEQYRRLKLRDCAVCPFGLDCRKPGQAVAAIWNLLSLMRYKVEPFLKRNRDSGALGWEWDGLIYQALANSLGVLGLDDDERDIMDIVEEERKQKNTKRNKRSRVHAAGVSMW